MPEQPQPPPTDGTDISALAAVMNPVTVGLQEKKVFVWANSTDNSTLGFQQRPLYSSKKQDFIGHKGTNQTPKITNPSTLAAIVRDDMVQVYGVTVMNDNKVISMLAPVVDTKYKPSAGDPKVYSGRIGGCVSDKDDSAWIYFQGEKAGQTGIYRLGLSESAGGRVAVKTDQPAMSNTGIASFYAVKQRFIVYQTSSSAIRLRNDTKESEYQVTDSSEIAKDQTPLAVTFIPGDAPQVVIYFLNKKLILYRASFSTDAKLTYFTPNHPKKVSEDAIQVQDLTQLSIVPDTAKMQNVIYFMREEETNLSIVADPWVEEK